MRRPSQASTIGVCSVAVLTAALEPAAAENAQRSRHHGRRGRMVHAPEGQGYTTGQFGKNHLADQNEYLPTAHGFDTSRSGRPQKATIAAR